MLVLFDNGTPRTLARFLIGHHMVTEARARGWTKLENGELLKDVEAAGFKVLVTTDKNLRYQQNLTNRKIALVVRGHGRWGLIRPHIAQVIEAINSATPGRARQYPAIGRRPLATPPEVNPFCVMRP